MTPDVLNAVTAMYDQNLAESTRVVKRLGPIALVVFRKLTKTFVETEGDTDKVYDHMVADMALIGLTTCLMTIEMERDND